MAFYVWDTPEVAKYFGQDKYCEGAVYTSADGTGFVYHTAYLNGFTRQLKESCTEYKLHPAHGLIPANSKLFKEDTNKEHKEKQMKRQRTKKVFEVGDKCIIKNIDNKFYVYEEATENFVDKEVKIVSKFTIPSTTEDSDINMVSVMNECGQCICFREEMCYPVKTEKEKAIDEMREVVCSQGFLSKNGTVSWEIAKKLYEVGYRKVGE